MISVKSSACLAALLAAHGICLAQMSVRSSSLPPPGQMDMHVGAIRSSDSGDRMTDGGIRTAPTPLPQSINAPIVTLGKDYRIGINDLVDVEILDLENAKRTVRVNAAGAISLPLIGRVSVAGMTTQEVEEHIADRYREKYLQNPQVSVFIKEFTTERITVEGAVNHPGMFPLNGQLTLLRALAVAGGFGPIANINQVMLYRVNDKRVREVTVHDVSEIRAGKQEDPQIKGDDLIVVQRDNSRVLFRDSLFRDIVDTVNPLSYLK